MLRLRPYRDGDAGVILSWCRDEFSFYQWTAGVLGSYPLSEKDFGAVRAFFPFTAVDRSGPVGFFTLREPEGTADELRFGFVTVAPERHGSGLGKEMLRLWLVFASDVYRAGRVSLAVFADNTAAYHCYRAAGFEAVSSAAREVYYLMGQDWPCLELAVERRLTAR